MPGKLKAGQADSGKAVRFTTIKVRLDPTPEQAELFEKTFGCCRFIWNQMLSDQQGFYAETDAHFIPSPAKYKREAPFLKEADNQARIQEYNKLSQAFRVFFKNPASFGCPNLIGRRTTGIRLRPAIMRSNRDRPSTPPGTASA